MAGGINTYAYALSDPILLSDPLGLWVPQAVGAAVNTGFEGYRQYQAGEFSPQRLLVAAATGAMGGFGSTAARAIGFGALSGSTQNAFNQVVDFDNECNRIEGGFMNFDVEAIVRGAFFGGLGGVGGNYGSGIGRRLYKKHDIKGVPLDKKIRFNYESEGAAIGTALGTAYGNQ